jgi:protein-disulfide isomerase
MAKRNRQGQEPNQQGDAQTRAQNRRAQRVVQQQQAKRKRLLTYLGGAVGIALVAVLVLVLVNQSDSAGASDEPINPPPAQAEGVPKDGLVLGSPDAPVNLIEYADFQCPGCGSFARTFKPQRIQEYVQTGQVKLEFYNFAFLGDESIDAAQASLCANDQGKFWEMHDVIFQNQISENEGAFDRDRLRRMAEVIGLDMAAYDTCMDENRYRDQIQEAEEAGNDLGIQGTPSFNINGEIFLFNSYPDLQQRLDAAIAAAGGSGS